MKSFNIFSTNYILAALIVAAGTGFSFNHSTDKSTENDKKEVMNNTIDVPQGNPETGVGPFKKVDLGKDINISLAEQGKVLYEGRCIACHKFEERFIGPPLSGVTERRNPVWIMNMIINPNEMVEKDPIGKELLAEYKTPMINMGVNEEDTRAILEYLRAHDKGKLK
jgi:mono/diheme cytochrome c family protein